MGEEDLWYSLVDFGKIVESDEDVVRSAKSRVIQSADHRSNPGSTRLRVGHENVIRFSNRVRIAYQSLQKFFSRTFRRKNFENVRCQHSKDPVMLKVSRTSSSVHGYSRSSCSDLRQVSCHHPNLLSQRPPKPRRGDSFVGLTQYLIISLRKVGQLC